MEPNGDYSESELLEREQPGRSAEVMIKKIILKKPSAVQKWHFRATQGSTVARESSLLGLRPTAAEGPTPETRRAAALSTEQRRRDGLCGGDTSTARRLLAPSVCSQLSRCSALLAAAAALSFGGTAATPVLHLPLASPRGSVHPSRAAVPPSLPAGPHTHRGSGQRPRGGSSAPRTGIGPETNGA